MGLTSAAEEVDVSSSVGGRQVEGVSVMVGVVTMEVGAETVGVVCWAVGE